MAKYQVGDIVRIKKGLKASIEYDITDGMTEHAGKLVRIESIVTHPYKTHRYTISIEGVYSIAVWHEKCFKRTAFSWDAFKTGKVQVHTPTRESFDGFRELANENGCTWGWSGRGDINGPYWWSFNKDRTCFIYMPGSKGATQHRKGFKQDEVPIFKWNKINPALVFDWQGFEAGELTVKCTSEEAYKRFMVVCASRGMCWCSSDKPTELNVYLKSRPATYIECTEDGRLCYGDGTHISKVVTWK